MIPEPTTITKIKNIKTITKTEDLVRNIISQTERNRISIKAAQTLRYDPEISKIELEDFVYLELETTAKNKQSKLTHVEKKGLQKLSKKIAKEVINNEENNNNEEETE
jgi:hypothetical protein